MANNMYLSVGVLLSSERKTAANISISLNISHDKVQRLYGGSPDNLRDKLKQVSSTVFDTNSRVTFVVDDTVSAKKSAQNIEWLDVCWNGSQHMPTIGHQFLHAMITE